MDVEERILQIIPATGWGARYTGDPENLPFDAVVCFALVERCANGTTWQEVRPMGPDGKAIDFIDTAGNFSEIVYAPDRL